MSSDNSNIPEIRLTIFTNKYFESRSFYEEDLGLEVYHQLNDEEFERGTIYKLGSCFLELLEIEYTPAIGDTHICIQSANIDKIYQYMKGKYNNIVEDFAVGAWGHRYFMMVDPTGNKIKLFSKG